MRWREPTRKKPGPYIMAEPIIEATQEAPDRADLDNLPEGERKETEAILGDIENGGKKSDAPVEEGKEGDDDVTPPAPKPEVPVVEKPTPEVPVVPVVDKKPAEERRQPTLVPAYVLKIQEEQANKKISQLETDLAAAREAGKKALDAGAKPEDAQVTLDKRLEGIAEKSGIKVEVLKEISDLFKPGPVELPEELKNDLKVAKDLRAEREVEVEAAKYSADFDRLILPLVQAEYGKDVPADALAQIKEGLKAKAYSPEYAKVPYSTIYKGEDEFRNLVNPKGKGGEGSRGGTVALSEADAQERAGGVDWKTLEESDSLEWDESVIRKLSDADFDKYGDVMTKRETLAREKRNSKR